MTFRTNSRSLRRASILAMIACSGAVCRGEDPDVRSRQAQQFPAAARFQFLADDVLPLSGPDRIRIDFEFASLNSVGPGPDRSSPDDRYLARIISPVTMQVDTAQVTHLLPTSLLRMLVHTGGTGRESIARFKSLPISAEKIE
jgi:hypothetical protein